MINAYGDVGIGLIPPSSSPTHTAGNMVHTSMASSAARPAPLRCSPPAGDTVHTVVTSSGDGYQNFQSRIM